MSTSQIVDSFIGHSYRSTKPDFVFTNIGKAKEEQKCINLSSGRFISSCKYNTYWYCSTFPFAIPIELATSQVEANLVFTEYIRRYSNLPISVYPIDELEQDAEFGYDSSSERSSQDDDSDYMDE